jgi:hypothetical protein
VKGRALAPAALLAAGLIGMAATPQAHAGTYVVDACTVGGVNYDNRSWTQDGPAAPGIAADLSCAKAGDPIGLTVAAGATTPDNTYQRLIFDAPKGATISDFRLDRRFTFVNPEGDGTHRYYAYYAFAGEPIGGSGNYLDGTRDRLHAVGSWYGYPAANADLGRGTVGPADFPILRSISTPPTRLLLRVGCVQRGTPCHVNAGGGISNQLFGAQVTISDPTAPALTVAASGLLAGGQRSGSDPVTVTATDNSGIRRVDLIDVTGGGAIPVGSEDYAAAAKTGTDKGRTCSPRDVHQCPDLSGETIRPTSLTVGRRDLVVRVTDTAGNTAQQGPYQVDVGTPSDRGVANGSGASETGTLSARFATGGARRTVDYGLRPTVEGRLVNASGDPVSGAELVVLTRDAGSDQFTTRGRLRTNADGEYAFKARSAASRLIQVAWRSHVNDVRFTENAYVSMRVRAHASLHAPSSVRVGHRFALTGTLSGVKPPGGVHVVAQGAGPGRGYATFADGRAGRSGRFTLHYRFQSAASRGHTFKLRVKLLARPGWPYEDGLTRTVRVRVR